VTTTVGSPSTPRGRRTRAQLVEAASEVFAEKRFLDTNVSDIVARAGMAHGTFYRYFNSKEQIFREVALELQRTMLTSSRKSDSSADGDEEEVPPHFDSLDEEMCWRITRANRRYLDAYVRNAKLFAVIEQVATFNEELREIRREMRRAFVDRAQRSIERMQSEGLALGDVDARYAASALGSMVDRFAYVWLVLDEPFEFEEAARTLGLLWTRSLGLTVPTGESVPASKPDRPA
jgi:AcrR family transcriptional regulator